MINNYEVAIISHDAGGAEILSSWVSTSNYSSLVCAEGPAINIFKRKNKNFKNNSLNYTIDKCDWVLTGTSSKSELEINAIILAKSKNKKVITFLDHWKNYKKRFLANGDLNYPHEIYVGDEDAEILAKKTFKSIPVSLVKNPYWIQTKKEILNDKMNLEEKKSLLYLSSNFDLEENILNLNNSKDIYIFDIFLKKIKKIIEVDISNITISHHPSEFRAKYSTFGNSSNINIVKNKMLLELIKRHEYIVGCDNMALVIAKLSGKKTINLSSKVQKCHIPSKYFDINIDIEKI
ncbi:hypothetical protein OAK17_08520 [Alphaproteobacteria bacterium]|nr:hypothetical protein [Alphaproteobacteria bacterium]